MGSGKRASMREGPLANLFRKTETEGLEPRAGDASSRRAAARARHARRRRSGCATRSAPRSRET